MLIVLYEENGEQHFEETNLEMNDFAVQNPNKNIIMVFDKDNEKYQKEQEEKKHFELYAHKFGFSSEQRNAVFTNGRGTLLKLVDFLPDNKGYECLCENTYGERYKMAPGYVARKIQEYNTARKI